ncbi:MAG: DUF4209 domain-containing protein [Muribaculaceae bacterium]|nr:DUF4209 domain-containing protein [Muribaculaceae bacterium]
MKTSEMLYTVESIRAYLEDYQTKDTTYNLFSDNKSDNKDVCREIGYNRFLLKENFKSQWTMTALEDSTQEDVIAYSKQRLKHTDNIHLKARYSEALLVMTKNNQYASQTIDAYLQIAYYYLEESIKDVGICFEFLDVIEKVIVLCSRYDKGRIAGLASYLKEIIVNNYPLQLKTGILRIFSEKNEFKAEIFKGLTDECLVIYNLIKNRNWKENILKIGIRLSERLNDRKGVQKFAELLGDLILLDIQEYDDTNIAISHINENTYQRAIKYFKLAGNNAKISLTTSKLVENRTHHQYLRIPIYDKIINPDVFNQKVKDTIESSLVEILYPICRINSYSFIPSSELINKLVPKSEESYEIDGFPAVSVDHWGNTHPTTAKSMLIRDTFIHIFQRFALQYIPLLLCNCMIYKKQKISQFRSSLKKAGFCVSIPIKRRGEYVLIPLYDIVGKGLEDFIRQTNESFKKNPKVDWRFCVDFLTPKFELIIRSIANVLSIPVVKQLRNGETQFITLENILANPKLKVIFNEDDILLFKQTFTKDGLNIRNEVAHGLLLPQDYNSLIALYVFLSVLRLCKIADFMVEQYNKQGH